MLLRKGNWELLKSLSSLIILFCQEHFVKMLSINFWHSLRLHPICSSMLLPFFQFPSPPPQRLEKIPPINIKRKLSDFQGENWELLDSKWEVWGCLKGNFKDFRLIIFLILLISHFIIFCKIWIFHLTDGTADSNRRHNEDYSLAMHIKFAIKSFSLCRC